MSSALLLISTFTVEFAFALIGIFSLCVSAGLQTCYEITNLGPSSCLSPHMPSTHSCPYSCHIPQRALLGSLGEAPSYCFVCVLALMSADTMILALFPMIPEQGFAPKRRQTYLSSELPGPSAQEVLRKRSPQSLTWIGYYLVCC